MLYLNHFHSYSPPLLGRCLLFLTIYLQEDNCYRWVCLLESTLIFPILMIPSLPFICIALWLLFCHFLKTFHSKVTLLPSSTFLDFLWNTQSIWNVPFLQICNTTVAFFPYVSSSIMSSSKPNQYLESQHFPFRFPSLILSVCSKFYMGIFIYSQFYYLLWAGDLDIYIFNPDLFPNLWIHTSIWLLIHSSLGTLLHNRERGSK